MKKSFFVACFFIFFLQTFGFSAESQPKTFHGRGEVTSVSPLFSRITIDHETIKDFAGTGNTEFSVNSKNLITNINTGDLVEFDIADSRGDVQIIKITKTGVAVPKEGVPVGSAVQGAIESTGQAVNTITKPIQPVNEVANSAMGATTQTTGSVLDGADTQTKNKF